MTKKHYKMIADVFRDCSITEPMDEMEASAKNIHKILAEELSFAFSRDNPRFDHAKFMTACGVDYGYGKG